MHFLTGTKLPRDSCQLFLLLLSLLTFFLHHQITFIFVMLCRFPFLVDPNTGISLYESSKWKLEFNVHAFCIYKLECLNWISWPLIDILEPITFRAIYRYLQLKSPSSTSFFSNNNFSSWKFWSTLQDCS